MIKSMGYIVRLVQGKTFGFVRINQTDYFFHRDDYNGNWNQLSADLRLGDRIEITCEIVDSPKGPRVANVSRISMDMGV